MLHQQKETNTLKSLSLSVKPFTLDGADNTIFEWTEIPLKDVKDVLTSKNYSTIHWNGKRLGDNFIHADAIMVDLDHNATIDDAVAKLDELNLSYILVTSKSHSPEEHRFHLIIPLDRPIVNGAEYKAFVEVFCEQHFPNYDRKVRDAGRFLYGSPSDAEFMCNWDRNPIHVDDYPIATGSKINLKALDNEFLPTLRVCRADGSEIMAAEIMEKTAIYCPFHTDSNPSAFISYHSTEYKHYIHCSSCNGGTTWWEKTSDDILEKKCGSFWSHKSKVYEAGIVGDVFSFQDVGKEKFFIRTRTKSKEAKENLFDYLVTERHIHDFTSIEYHPRADFEESNFEMLKTEGKVKVKIAARPADLQDNDFIEDRLDEWFGKHKDFIKRWMAMYAYTNFTPLPTLIFIGERSSGKSKAAEMISSIFPSMSLTPHDVLGQFNPYAEKKLILIDESTREGRIRYEQLKQFSGSEYMEVNKKGQPQLPVRNNLHVILMSNSKTPVFVRRGEMPKDEKNNQFFVYSFSGFKGPIDPNLPEKLKARMGHYVRTVLRDVYADIKDQTLGYRYSIPVPITADEEALFMNNATEIESMTDAVIEDVVLASKRETPVHENDTDYSSFFIKGYLPTVYLEEYTKNRRGRVTSIVQELRERGYLHTSDTVRRRIGDDRYSCYAMTVDFLREIQSAGYLIPGDPSKKGQVGQVGGQVDGPIFANN
ncbi:hypothetical protein KQI65_07140 [bacterium]|nr:hypothetical protein [bacterium]